MALNEEKNKYQYYRATRDLIAILLIIALGIWWHSYFSAKWEQERQEYMSKHGDENHVSKY